MDILLAILWIFSMVLYSFTSDYAVTFPDNKNKAIPFIRWGSLLMAMGLSGYLAKAYQSNLQGNGIWVFIIVVLFIITLSKVVFKWILKRRMRA